MFKVQEVVPNTISKVELVRLTGALEKNSTHPIAKVITDYAGKPVIDINVKGAEEKSGHGLKGKLEGKEVLAGNLKLLQKFNIDYQL